MYAENDIVFICKKGIFSLEIKNSSRDLIIDDIYTTGNTVNECSKVIKMAGAKEVAILTIAVD